MGIYFNYFELMRQFCINSSLEKSKGYTLNYYLMQKKMGVYFSLLLHPLGECPPIFGNKWSKALESLQPSAFN